MGNPGPSWWPGTPGFPGGSSTACCVLLGKAHALSEPRCHYLLQEDNSVDLTGLSGVSSETRLLKPLAQGLVPRKFSTHSMAVASHLRTSVTEALLWPPGSGEGKQLSYHHPPRSDGGSGPRGLRDPPEEAAPSVNFLEAQFAHHQSCSGRRIIRRGCVSPPESPGLAGLSTQTRVVPDGRQGAQQGEEPRAATSSGPCLTV